MKENKKTDNREVLSLHQMDTGKFPSVPAHLTLHHWTVPLLFTVKVNFKIRVTMFKKRDIIIFVSVFNFDFYLILILKYLSFKVANISKGREFFVINFD